MLERRLQFFGNVRQARIERPAMLGFVAAALRAEAAAAVAATGLPPRAAD